MTSRPKTVVKKVKFDWRKYFNFQGAVAVVVTLSALVGSVLSVNAYFVKDREFKVYVEAIDKKFSVIDKRIAQGDTNLLIHQTEQSQSYVQEKIWKVQDRVEQKPSDTAAKQQLRELETEKQKLDMRIMDLKEGKK